MFDGHFDPAFHDAFHARDDRYEPLAMPGWLTALTVAASVTLLAAVWLITASPEIRAQAAKLATGQPNG